MVSVKDLGHTQEYSFTETWTIRKKDLKILVKERGVVDDRTV